MKDYLYKLKQYEVNIRFDRVAFFANANLTASERKYLESHIGEVSLCYKAVLKNNQEMLVFLVELSNWDNEYAESSTAQMFASTLPYNCIVALRNGKAVRFWVFDRRDNIRNPNRSVIDGAYYSPIVLFDRNGTVERSISESICNSLIYGNNSAEVVNQIKCSFEKEHKQHQEEHALSLAKEGLIWVDPVFGDALVVHNDEYEVLNEIYGDELYDLALAGENSRKDDWKILRAFERTRKDKD